jgi:predicted dehydrogenase/dTDP-glucose pyrophosphorylase
MSFRKALLLAAGQGTRLGAATRQIPKPLLRVRGRPVLERHVEQLAAAGVEEIWINLFHQGPVIEDHFGDGRRWGVRIRYSRETTLLGTAGALQKLESEFADGPFFVVYGDNVGTCDYQALAAAHAPGALLTVALCHKEEVSQSGIAELDPDGRLRRFVEKPAPGEEFSHWVNAGFYAASPEVLAWLPAGVSDFGRDVIPRLLAAGRTVRGYVLPAPVEGIDTPEMLAAAEVLRVAVVGAGRMGARRAAVARAAGARVEWVVDPQTALAEELAQGGRVSADWREAVRDPQVDCVIVSTPNHLLAPVTLAALESRKHVLVEKPSARRAAELEPVVEAARRENLVCKAGFNYRFHPAVRRAYQMLRAGEIGRLLHVVARHGHGGRLGLEKEWRADPELSGGGQLLDQGVHLLDLCRWFAGEEFTRVQAVVATEFWPMPVEDTAFCLLRTAAGVTCSVLVSLVEWKNKFHFEAVGEMGSLVVEGLGGSYGPERLTVLRRPPEFGVPQVETEEFENPDRCWAEEWAEFTAAVRERRQPLGDIGDSLAVLRLVEACYRAC